MYFFLMAPWIFLFPFFGSTKNFAFASFWFILCHILQTIIFKLDNKKMTKGQLQELLEEYTLLGVLFVVFRILGLKFIF